MVRCGLGWAGPRELDPSLGLGVATQNLAMDSITRRFHFEST